MEDGSTVSNLGDVSILCVGLSPALKWGRQPFVSFRFSFHPFMFRRVLVSRKRDVDSCVGIRMEGSLGYLPVPLVG